jgi:hypothetical protein
LAKIMDDPTIKRRRRYQKHLIKIDDSTPVYQGTLYTCPCCGYSTLSSRAVFEICLLCNWEDDGQDDPFADEVWGGPNGDYSLSEARDNFNLYLTKYRQSDWEAFQQSTELLHIKRELIVLYNRMIELQDHLEIEELRIQAEELEQQL